MQGQNDEGKIQEITNKLYKKVELMYYFKPVTFFEQKTVTDFNFPEFLKSYDVHQHWNLMLFNEKQHILNS